MECRIPAHGSFLKDSGHTCDRGNSDHDYLPGLSGRGEMRGDDVWVNGSSICI